MLANGEHERVVERQTLTLRLHNIDVVALRMRSRVSGHKLVGRVFARMDDGNCKCQRVRNVLDAMHETALACVDLERAVAFVTRQQGLDRVPFHPVEPLGLCQSAFFHHIAALEEVAICIPAESPGLHFCGNLNICWDVELDVNHLEILDTGERGVIVMHLQIVDEVRWAGTWQVEEYFVGDGRTEMLLFMMLRHMCPANFGWTGQKVPEIC